MQATSVTTCLRVYLSAVCMAVLLQVPPAPLPASMWKKSQIPLLLSPGGLVLIITVQLLPTPSRLEPLSPWVGKLLAQVGLLTNLHWSKHFLHSFFSPCPFAFFHPIIYWHFMSVILFLWCLFLLIYTMWNWHWEVTGFDNRLHCLFLMPYTTNQQLFCLYRRYIKVDNEKI